MLEGRQLVKEAILAKEAVSILKIFCTRKFSQASENKAFFATHMSETRHNERRPRVEEISDKLLKMWSSVETSQGIIGNFLNRLKLAKPSSIQNNYFALNEKKALENLE